MRFKFILITVFMMMILGNNLSANDKKNIVVFYKDKPPSQKVLKRTNQLLNQFKEFYLINYYSIEDKNNLDVITKLGLPSTHFPFAIVINGKYTAKIDGKVVSFVHFPLFMKGIGRHEGNWSISDLEKVLNDNFLLSKEISLPNLEEETSTGECEE